MHVGVTNIHFDRKALLAALPGGNDLDTIAAIQRRRSTSRFRYELPVESRRDLGAGETLLLDQRRQSPGRAFRLPAVNDELDPGLVL